MNEQRPRIKGATEEIGEIVPPVDRRVAEDGDDDAGDDAIVEIDDGEEIGKKKRSGHASRLIVRGSAERLVAAAAPGTSRAICRHVPKILVLEDDPDVADAVRSLLELLGYEIVATDNGREAVVLAARDGFVLALLDIDVEELSGLGAERAIADFAPLPLIVYSAATSPRWMQEAFRGGASACLHKPIDVARLPEIVRALIGTPREGPPVDVTQLPPEDVDRLTHLDRRAIATLPFGIVELDRDGIIVGYNAYEAAAADRSVASVLGRRFVDVAPCMRVRRFVAAVEEAFATRALDRVLRFVFPSYGALTVVAVRLFFDVTAERLWLFVSRRAMRAGDRLAAEAPLP